MPEYRYDGAVPDTLGNGRPLAPGDVVTLEAVQDLADGETPSGLGVDDPHNARLIESGVLGLVPQRDTEPDDGEPSEATPEPIKPKTKPKGAKS